MSVLATRDELLIGGRRGMELDPDMIVGKEIATLFPTVCTLPSSTDLEPSVST